MNILQIAPQIPYPLTDGGKVGIFNITKHLAQRGHLVTLLCFKREEHGDITPLMNYCRLVAVSHSTKNSLIALIKNMGSSVPYNISKYYSQEMITALHDLVQRQKFDIVHVDHVHMAHYGVYCKNNFELPVILREHNIESTIMDRYASAQRLPVVSHYFKVQHKKLVKYESQMASEFNRCAVITKIDENRLKKMQPAAKTVVIPGGVSAKYFEEGSFVRKLPFTMTFVGGLDWKPNRDGLEWFIDEIMPKILNVKPESRLIVIGKNVPLQMKKRESSSIVFKGFVEDLKSEVQSSYVSIAPIRIGGGIRLKILESFAMKVPVVSTSIGCEGIECEHGEHLLIGDSAAQFAEMIIRLFNDQQLYERLVNNSYNVAQRMYRWEQIAQLFEDEYQLAISELFHS